MKALTLHQPWASLVALGVKTIETRSWSTTYRGPLAIHAGARRPPYPLPVDDGAVTVSSVHPIGNDRWSTGIYLHNGIGHADLPLGVIVATCTLVDIVPMVAECDGTRGSVQHLVVTADDLHLHAGYRQQSVEPQRPYGDFSPGRYAWLLDDVKACDPIPARGKQGLWEFAVSAPRGAGEPDASDGGET